MTLTPAFLDEVRTRTTLSGLIGRSVKLQRAGNEFRACCPFHDEKTPSFYVNDQKGFYHCFGCGAHGDAIRWLTEQQGSSFVEAVKELADAAGLDMPAPDPAFARRQQAQAGLHDVTAAAAEWFHAQLRDSREARAYLDRRGLTRETVDAFGIGYAPDGRTRLKEALGGRFEEAMLVEAGLLINVDGRAPYDRFRDRLMIPIKDPRGRVIAFGGRVIGAGEPKYLNSPDTPLFDKGRTLFNLDRAAPAARKAGRLFVVEGYLDVLALHQAGIAEAVAPLGTALTEAQMGRLWSVVDVPTLCFDGDAAGARAAVRSGERALPVLQLGKSLRFATLPAGQDPDDLVKAGGASAWEAAVSAAAPLVDLLYCSASAEVAPQSPDDRAALRARLDALAASAQDRLVAEEYKRSFTALFFEDHGWKGRHRAEVERAVVRTGPRGPDHAHRLLIRSILYGLTRYPRVMAHHLETVMALPIHAEELRRWREVLAELSVTRPDLDQDGIEAILQADLRPEETRFDIVRDLRFAYTRDDADAADAIAKLVAAIEMLREERDLAEQLARLDANVMADTGLDRYDMIEAHRRSLRDRRRALLERGAELGTEDTGAGDGGHDQAGGD